MKNLVTSIFIMITVLSGCNSEPEYKSATITPRFSEYWFAGKAEVVSYELNQARYGESRKGHAVLIFVTEPFSNSHHVKLDDPETAGSDKVTVMKLNMMKKFVTGIYPYSMMLSVFSPLDNDQPPHPLKLTMSSQEWCGQVFSQMNRKQDKYRLQQFSYFQTEGDSQEDLPGEFLEDEIWNMIRMDPGSLPVGEIEIYPGLFYSRLNHKPMAAEFANATLIEENGEQVYELVFSAGRKIEWRFSTDFPFTIRSWREEFPDNNGRQQVTTGEIKKSLFIPYWQFNGNDDIILRDSLGI